MDVAGDSTGFILSTSMTVSETHTTLLSGGLKPQDFDAVICNSGSELYFTASASSEDKTVLPYTHDPDYHSHIEFRWGGENLRKTLIRWISSVEAKKKLKQGEILCEDEASSTNYCLSFKVKDPASVNTHSHSQARVFFLLERDSIDSFNLMYADSSNEGAEEVDEDPSVTLQRGLLPEWS